MKKLFLDTNIVLDFLIREEYSPLVRELISKSEEYDLLISYLTVANTAYIMRKYPKDEITIKIGLLLDLFEIIPNDRRQIEQALLIDNPDFEDMLQYQAAKSRKCDVILTRNVKDFLFSDIPVMDIPTFLNSLSSHSGPSHKK